MTRTVLLCATVALLPLLVPKGPGNTAPVDAFAMLFIAVALVAVAHRREPFRAPAALALLAVFVPTGIATMVSLSPGTSLVSLIVEIYLVLLMWLAATTMANRPAAFRAVLVTWAVASAGWALLMIATHYQVLPRGLLDLLVAHSSSSRVSGTAKNPNLAASYLVTSFFVVLVAPLPFRRLARWAVGALILWAVLLTESNGALLAAVVGMLVVASAVPVRRVAPRARVAVAAAGVLLVAVVVGAAAVTVAVPAQDTTTVNEIVQIGERGNAGPLSANAERLDKGISARVAIWTAAWSGGVRNAAFGVGPGAGQKVDVGGSDLNKGLHNDYLAFFLERGVLGLVAFLFFLCVLLWWCIPLLLSERVNAAAGVLGRTGSFAGLAGAVVANAAMPATHESFHFRHLWLLIALVWAARYFLSEASPGRQAPHRAAVARREEQADALV
ncbi:MAG TPA: O-antigen ligase family protein [Mycobacteriales bacterium]|nr:O-antigen ligase family protein [Mycobacteriales bacterium]